MVPLAALLACSLFADDALVAAIADNVEQNPLSILTLEGRSDPNAAPAPPETLEQARSIVRELIAHGGSPLLGVMQVPPAWALTFGREPEDLFDACVNVSIGTAILSEFDYACARAARGGTVAKAISAGVEARRRCVLDRYSNAIGMPEVSTVVALSLRYSRPRTDLASDAPIYALPTASRTWGADCLMFHSSTEDPSSQSLAGMTREGRAPPEPGHLLGSPTTTTSTDFLGRPSSQHRVVSPR
jgi:hypothetical protein